MNRQLTTKDIQLTALVLGLLLILCGVGLSTSHKMSLQREDGRMSQQMEREAQLAPEVPSFRSHSESRTNEQMNREAELGQASPPSNPSESTSTEQGGEKQEPESSTPQR